MVSGTSAKLSRSVVSFEAKTRERGRAENIGRQGFFSCGSEAAGRHSLPVGAARSLPCGWRFRNASPGRSRMEERCRIPIARPSDGMLRAGRGICCGADDGSLRFAIFAVEENEPCYDDQSQTTLSGTCGPDFRQPDDARSGARRGRVPVRPGRTAVDRSDLRRVGQRRRARQPPGDRRDLRSGARLPSSDGLRRGGRVAAGALCRADRFAAARSARHGLLRQFGQRGRRRGAQTGQALYRPYRAGLLPECLSRQYGPVR